MADNPREILSELSLGGTKLASFDTPRMKAWQGCSAAAFKGGVLDAKTKELIALAIGLSIQCKYCIVHHVHEAFKNGATREEVVEAAFTAIGMSGGPAVTYSATLLMESIETFAPDYDK